MEFTRGRPKSAALVALMGYCRLEKKRFLAKSTLLSVLFVL
jgi:hypothetical protein